MREITLSLIRVTEAAAIAASKWVGSGNKEEADKAATGDLRRRLNQLNIYGKIVIGEGKKDKSYGLFNGEEVGSARHPIYDIAVDPIEGTTPTVNSGPEALSVVAIANEGAMFATEHFYMNKLAYGPRLNKRVVLNINDPLDRTIELVSKAMNKKYSDIMVCILDRNRHSEPIKILREMGVRIKLIQDCDISGAVATCRDDSDVDLLYGIGGAPEAVLTACAMKCLGGDIQAQITTDRGLGLQWGKIGDIMHADDLVKGECVFVATGITDGSLLKGVRYRGTHPVTHTVVMRSESGTIRWIEADHGN